MTTLGKGMRHVKHRIVILLCLFSLATGISRAELPLRIGVSIGLTGCYSPMAGMYSKGLCIWERDINSKGGILGRPVKLLIYDDHSSPQEAVKIYDRMLTKENVDLVMGPYSSTIGSAVAPIIERHRMPTLFPLAAADAIWASRPKYVFGMHTCARRWISAVLAFFARQGVERVGILVNEELFKLGTPRETNKWAKRFGQKILMKEVPNPQHVGEQIDRARKLEVEGLIVWGYMDDAVTVRKAMARADWYPQIFFSQSAPALPDYQRRLGPLANFTVGTSVWESSIAQLRPGGKSFIEAFRQEYKTEPVYHAAMGFAAGQVLAKAISRAGTLDREKIRHELAALDMVTIVGRYRVDYRGMQVRRSPLIIQWQEGQKRVIWPEALSNGQLRLKTDSRH